MIGYHAQNIAQSNILADSTGKIYKNDWVEVLLQEPYGVFYDIDMAVAVLLHYLQATPSQCRKLLDSHKLHIAPYTFTYYPGKLLAIDKGYGRWHFYCNLYNAKQYTDIHHEDNPDIDKLVAKAVQAANIAKQVLDSYKELGICSNSLTSPIAALEKSGLMPKIPTIDDIPEEAHMLAYQCVKGNWLECYKLGYFPDVYDYDINGAYGSELANLLDLRRGKWSRELEKETVYGFVRGTLRIEAPFHPFLVSDGEMSYSVTGKWETVLTLQEIKFLRKYKLGQFEPKEGWYWTPTCEKYEPYKGIVRFLWGKRMTAREKMTNTIVKRLLAGLWGKTLELRGTPLQMEFGAYFNPIYGAIVEANCRLKVAAACLDSKIIPLSVAVDGVVTDQPLSAVTCNGGLGDWRLSHRGKCIIISSGIVGIEGKEANEDFSIKYDWLYEKLSTDPEATQYKMVKLAPVTLAKAFAEDKWEKLGKLEWLERTIYVGDENKRCYREKPQCGRDVLERQYDSYPWDISIIRRHHGQNIYVEAQE